MNVEAIYHAEGRLTPNGTDFHYEYTLKDHLGNARVSFRAISNGTAIQHLQENHYYPFGMEMEGPWQAQVGVENQYQYNGKELNEDFGLNLMDYGARWYDGALGRWGSVDPLGEMTRSWSSYVYVENTPPNAIDPDGNMCLGCKDSDDATWLRKIREKQGFHTFGSNAGGPTDPCKDCPNLPVTGPKGDGVLNEVVVTAKAPTEPQSSNWLTNATIATHARSDASPKDVRYLYGFADNTPEYWATTLGLMFATEAVVEVGAWSIAAVARNGTGAVAKGGMEAIEAGKYTIWTSSL